MSWDRDSERSPVWCNRVRVIAFILTLSLKVRFPDFGE